MSKKKDQLGKGLRALLTKIDEVETKPTQKKEIVEELARSIAKIDVNTIEPNPYQPRKQFDEAELLELVQSIKTLGLIQPVTLRKVEGAKFQIISGERRWRASKLAGLTEIPAYLRITDDQGMLEMALVENIQRSDLNALEIAFSYQRLIDECNLQHEELAKRVGKERSTVTNYTRLLKLPPSLQEGLKARRISMGHAKALLSLDNPTDQIMFFKKIAEEGLSVRNTEKIIRNYKNGGPASSAKAGSTTADIHPEVRTIQDRLASYLSSKVDISRSASGKGKIVIHFMSDDQFNDIVDNIEESH